MIRAITALCLNVLNKSYRKDPPSMLSLYRSALFFYAFASGLLLMTLVHLFANWTGDWGSGLFIFGTYLVAFLLACLLRNTRTSHLLPALTFLAALLPAIIFLNTEELAHAWELLSMRAFVSDAFPQGLSWEMWHTAAFRTALFWFCPIAFAQMFLWGSDTGERGKTIVAVGACTGVILARILCAGVPTDVLLMLAIALLLFAAPLIAISSLRQQWTRVALLIMALALPALWCTLHLPPKEEMLSRNFFASIATRDLNLMTLNRTYRDGRVVRCEGINTAPEAASQLIPLLLKPYDNARIAYRLQGAAPLLSQYDTTLKGLYDAIFVELPPAWMRSERDYFGSGAIASLKEHLMPDGVGIYQLDARCLDAKLLIERLSILKERFGFIQLWMTERNMWQIVFSQTAIKSDITAISNLIDRKPIATLLYQTNIHTPLHLLSSYLTDDFSAIQAALAEPIRAAIPLRESHIARQLLFSEVGGGRLINAFEGFRDYEMTWIHIPEELKSLRDILVTFQNARHLALTGKLLDAAKANPNDPFLLAIAERDITTARAMYKMGKQHEAMTLYVNAFAIAAPQILALLEAADSAQKANLPAIAKEFYALAEKVAPNDLTYLFQYMEYLASIKQYRDSLALAERIVILSGEQETHLAIAALGHSAKMMAKVGKHEDAIRLAHELATSARHPEDKARFIPLYADILIECGKMKEAFDIKTHFEQTGEVLSERSEE